MKLLIFSLFLPFSFFCQITITDSDMPMSGNSHFYSNVIDLTSVDVAQTGPNYNWDFSSLNQLDQDTLSFVNVTSTPLTFQFYFNNPFLYPDHYATLAQIGMDASLLNSINITDRYDYYKLSNSSYELVGYGANLNGVPSSVKYDTIDQIYPLPLNYGTVDSTTAYYLASIPSLGSYGQWIRRKVEVDGWGTLMSPYSTYNVLRVKTTLYQQDTIFVDQLMSGYSVDRPVVNIYEWYANGQGAPVFIVLAQNGIVTEIKYKDDLQISFVENELDLLSLYPNPVIDRLSFSYNLNKFSFIELYNNNGVKIMEMEYEDHISLAHLKSGSYILKISYNNHYKVFKLLKL